MSSGDQEAKQNSLKEYEKDYLSRLEKEKKSGNLQDIIFQMTQEIKKLETKDYIGFCTFCTMGVERKEMVYKNNLLFHPNCFEQQGKNFPPGNQEILNQTTIAKVQLVLLKNLKARTSDISNVSSPQSSQQSRPKPKKRSKPKRKTKKKRKAKRKRRARRKVVRKSKKRPQKRRRKATKRRKSKRTSRKRPTRRRSRPKPRRRTKRSSSRRRRR